MSSVAELLAWLESAPPGTSVSATAIAETLREAVQAEPVLAAGSEATVPAPWRERLWTCPPETRLTTAQVAEALGRSRDGVYRLTKAELPLPHRKAQDGSLVFVAADVRQWIANTEQTIAGPPAPYALRVIGGRRR